jgi:hypothetical protein
MLAVALGSLWLPILVSAVIVFMAGCVLWMVMPHHKSDWKGLPDEDTLFETLKSKGVQPGQYMFPFCTRADWKDAEKKARWERGPHGVLNLYPAKPSMGGNLLKIFLFDIVVGIFVAYLAGIALAPGAEYLKVFQITGTAALLAYAFGRIPDDIWNQRSCRTMFNNIIDSIVYALLTAGVFGWLWPAA